MKKIFSKAGIVSLIFFAMIDSTSATVFISTSAGLNREIVSIIKNTESSVGKMWINSRTKELSSNLKYAQSLRGDEARLYRQELATIVSQFVEDIRNNTYSFSVTQSEREQVESTILSYQRDFAEELQRYIDRYKNNDSKQTGDIHFTLQSQDIKVDIHIDRYKVIQSRDLKNMEIDMQLSIRMSGKGIDGDLSVTLDGKVLLIGTDLYVTLRDASFFTTIEDAKITEYQKLLSGIKGKTYHQVVDDSIGSMLQENQSSLDMIEKMMSILNTRALLTPVAKQGTDYILMFNKLAVRDISSITGNISTTDLSLKNLLIPADIRISGSTIGFHGYMENIELQATLSRDTTDTVIMEVSGTQRGGYDNISWKLSKTPNFWALAWESDEYSLDTTADKNGATATIKRGDKTIATARISSTGLNAWTYNMSATFEDSSYDWDTGESIMSDIVIKLWGSMRDEFGEFRLVPPTIYEELENNIVSKINRDSTRVSDLMSISSDFYYYGYPKVSKDGCIAAVNYRKNGYNPYSNIVDPKSLGAVTCPDGYWYRSILNKNGEESYLLVAHTETREAANYDASRLDITTATHEEILANISDTIVTSDNANNWYYVYIPDAFEVDTVDTY